MDNTCPPGSKIESGQCVRVELPQPNNIKLGPGTFNINGKIIIGVAIDIKDYR